MPEIRARVRYLFGRESHARDLSEELDAHLQMEIEANLERGMSPDEARAVARRQFGSPARLRESAHDAWAFHWLESVLQDIRYGFRQFRRAPGLFLAVIASLAIGLGANTAIFSLVDAAVLRPLPVRDPDRLVQLEWQNDRVPAGAGLYCGSMSGARNAQAQESARDGVRLQMPCVSDAVFRALADGRTGLASLIGISPVPEVAISTAPGAPPEQALLQYVSWNFFEGLGVPLALGRPFIEEDDRPEAEPTVVVSHRFWSSRLGRDPDAIGRRVRINDEPARIIGVAPPGFFGLRPGAWIDVYQPLALEFGEAALESPGIMATYWNVDLLARPAPGVSGSAAAAAMTPLFRGLVAETMGTEIEESLELVARPAARGPYAERDAEVRQALWILMLLVGVLLLIVSANVANLLLARSVKRRPESAVRLALGAGRRRLVRQHLVESGMLAVFGGAAGLGLGVVLAEWIHTAFQAGQKPWAAFAVTFDWRVSSFALAISALTAVTFGLAPAWTAARSQVSDALKVQSRSVLGGGLRLPKLLVSVQFALSFAALVAAGLLGRSLGNLYATDLGFDGEQLSFATVSLIQAGYPPDPAVIGQYWERLEQEIGAIPGVEAVAQLSSRPLEAEATGGTAIEVPGGPPAELAPGIPNPAATAYVSLGGTGFIEVLGLQLLAGRTLEPHEVACAFGQRMGAPAAGLCPVVVDQHFADVFFPGESAIGQLFDMGGRPYQVVGLVANARLAGLRTEARPTVYQQLDLVGMAFARHIAMRARIDSGALAAEVEQAVARVDPAVPLVEFHTQSGLVDRLLRTERLLALISGAFGLAALALAAVGLAGLLAYAVARRTNEIGIRMALGATGGQVRRMVLGDSLRMVGAGVLIGVPAAYAVGRYLESQLFGLEPVDPSTASLALITLWVIAGVAALVPAHRAARVNPLTALREE